MKTLPNKAIIYDEHCPMCALYTKGFVKMGLLQKENRIPFSRIPQSNLSKLNMHRSRHEIPLLDLYTGEVLYGIDSMVYLLKQKFPIIGEVMKVKPVYWFFKKLYKLVSYNRRVIAPAKDISGQIDITPDFNLKYRLFFIAFSIAFSVFVTFLFGESAANYLPEANRKYAGLKMLVIAGTGWIVQITVASFFIEFKKRIDYIGHLGVIMIGGVSILFPALFIGNITDHQFAVLPILSVACSSAFMLWQHFIRIKHLQLSQLWTLEWFLRLQITAAFWVYIFYFKNL